MTTTLPMTAPDGLEAAEAPKQPSPPPVLESAKRELNQATLVSIEPPQVFPGPSLRLAGLKAGFLRALSLQPGELSNAINAMADQASSTGTATQSIEALRTLGDQADPAATSTDALSKIPPDALVALGLAVARQRRDTANQGAPTAAIEAFNGGRPNHIAALAQQASAATQAFEANVSSSYIGMANLERIEMAPAGIERGELVATIPLAPDEQTSVTQKEWSVTSKEFTSIVTDSLETVSETGVTDNTELSQGTTSQAQHSNQFNITGTVAGGMPVIHGSTTAGFTGQDSTSQSATQSIKQTKELTQKASSRSRQEHKVTISTSTVSGTSETSTRVLHNPDPNKPMRIDYFSLMRAWRVRLYRYGLRATWDIVVPEPGAAMRADYAALETLRQAQTTFNFGIPHSDITADVRPGETEPHYLVLADRFDAQVPDPPEMLAPFPVRGTLPNPAGHGINDFELSFTVKDGYEVTGLAFSGAVTGLAGTDFEIAAIGTKFHLTNQPDQVYPPTPLMDAVNGQQAYLAGATGQLGVAFYFLDCSSAELQLMVSTRPTDAAWAKWRSDVWDALFNAAQTQYYANQQLINAEIATLEDRLNGVDTLTLRREESDEIMKCALRFLLGTTFEFMPGQVVQDFETAGVDIDHGIGFDGNSANLDPTMFAAVIGQEDVVRFLNQAIEWENVVTFLYSYFWDVPNSWAFIRQIQHPDADRQAFLRAGSARIVLTVRKGWEQAFAEFVLGLIEGGPPPPDHPYLTIAAEIAAYDDRNYPGIPPANAGPGSRVEDTVSTICRVTLGASNVPITITVDSTDGFVAGQPVVIGNTDDLKQEAVPLNEIVNKTQMVIGHLASTHDGSAAPMVVFQPGEKGALIAEWREYTPLSGTDIAVTSDLGTIT